jgi:hypothetical protein
LGAILNIRVNGAVLNGAFNYYGCSIWVIGVIDDVVWDSGDVFYGEVCLGDVFMLSLYVTKANQVC